MVRQLLFTLLLCGVCHASDVRLAWDASPDPVTGYIVYRSAATITDTSQPEWRNTGNVLQFTWADAPVGLSYYRLKAINAYGRSGYSNEVSAFVPAPGCGGCGQPPCPEPANNLRMQ